MSTSTTVQNESIVPAPQLGVGRDVHTTINYYKDPGDGTEHAPSLAGKRSTFNQPQIEFPTVIHDISHTRADFTLDRHGFQLLDHRTTMTSFMDDEMIKKVYYPEIEDLLFQLTRASRVHIFDHTIRRPKPEAQDPDDERRPVKRAHIDQSGRGTVNQIRRHMGAEAERLLRCRYQVINVWRPINTIYRDQLAVCNSHSVPEKDILPVKLIYPDWIGEPCTIRPNPKHEWYYKFAQTPEEVMMIKCYDSKADGRARRVPHAAFNDPEMADRAPRQSIEVRALVFHEDDHDDIELIEGVH
ncbi:hypothetical protein KVT40_003783 [Elsinoe batatas]|uniref:Methyltransferase n=1 Tax=Elsinoe batatas TaxID=2601811 RepID=A0A8K0L5M3_9PEZI|nr:hypothetical protein KVT40_003783 [Elsinoe batatas]